MRLFVPTLIHLISLVKELSLVSGFSTEDKVTVVWDEILMQNFCDINCEDIFEKVLDIQWLCARFALDHT